MTDEPALDVVVHEAEEDGGYWAEVPTLPGCLGRGATVEEALENLRETMEGWPAPVDDDQP